MINYSYYDEILGLCEEVRSRLRDQLSLKMIFTLPPKNAALYRMAQESFGAQVAVQFPSALYEIEEAGKCIALDRFTACVFHLMRILEAGIEGARKCLGIPDPVKDADRNWGAILRKFKAEFERRDKAAPPEWNSPTDKDFFAEIHASLEAARNVWRNATMHVEKKYTPDEAEHIFAAVRGFMNKLSSRTDEEGQPTA